MKKMKYWILVALAVVIVGGLSMLTMDHQLKASDGDGVATATDLQEEKAAVQETVEIAVPADPDTAEATPAAEEAPAEEAAAPAEEEAPAEEAAPTEEAVKKSVSIKCKNKEIEIGDTVDLEAKLTGFDDSAVVTWQYKDPADPDEKWVSVDAHGTKYSFKMTEGMTDYQWRVQVDE